MLDLVLEMKVKIQLLLGKTGSKAEEADTRGVGAAIIEDVVEAQEVNLAVPSGRCKNVSFVSAGISCSPNRYLCFTCSSLRS
jgi:hypothetical protein